MPATTESAVETIRCFNRFYTRKIGVLQQGLLDSPYSLTEVRVLYEVAHRPGITAAELGQDLGLDAGYLSRLLKRFAQKRLLRREASPDDGRQSHLHLTPIGRKTFTLLNARSSDEIRGLLSHLTAGEQHRLADTLRTAHYLLTQPSEPRGGIRLREPRAGDWGWIVQRHGAIYAQEYGWDATFEALVARIVADFITKLDPGRERCWIAEIDGHPVGCVFLVRQSDHVAKLRLLLVEPSARGRGVGRKLIATCVAFARDSGYRKVMLWTNSVLHAARHLYEQAGFRLVRREAHHSFGHDLEGQTWELFLAPP